jgi:sulfatase modifying factor 1
MRNGQPTGAQNLSTTEDGSYYLNGATTDAQLVTVTRKANATWVIPTEDEWYKAAYHKNDGVTGNYWDYPTGTNAVPSNVLIIPDPGNDANYEDYSGTGNHGYTIGNPYWRTEVGAFTNSESPYGTFDQGGNVEEWNETVVGSSTRGVRGGSFDDPDFFLLASRRYNQFPASSIPDLGFRLAYIPEPATILILALASVGILRRKRT